MAISQVSITTRCFQIYETENEFIRLCCIAFMRKHLFDRLPLLRCKRLTCDVCVCVTVTALVDKSS